MKIKCCPFCGCDKASLDVNYTDRMLWTGLITCQHCNATGSVNAGQDSEEDAACLAITNWNKAHRMGWIKQAWCKLRFWS